MNTKWTQCWLRYDKKEKKSQGYHEFLSCISIVGVQKDRIIQSAVNEIMMTADKMFGITSEVVEKEMPSGIILYKVNKEALGDEGYHLETKDEKIIIEGNNSTAILYGVFFLLGMMQRNVPVKQMDITNIPSNPIRMLNHWDNMDGSIERGYSGNSFFFENNDIIINERTRDYARLMASVGINAVVINNVNVKDHATDLINPIYIDKVASLEKILADYSIKLFLSINYAMTCEDWPQTADPLDEGVIKWWENKISEIYQVIPNLGGFLVKADSEGRPGPFTYGRNQAQGANMLARAIKQHGGLIIWRCFVYNCKQDWRDLTVDRAKASYDYFAPLDGQFDDNVILQIKNGPMDFQVREPISPLFGKLKHTHQMLEVQIAQEYTGHQIDVCYLIPWFKEVLAFQTYAKGRDESATVGEIISGKTYQNKYAGMVAVANTGNDENWTGNDLAAANLYGFGRLAFDMDLSAQDIAKEWIDLTFSYLSEKAKDIILHILMPSWHTYENYTSPLGIGWMVTPNTHYGPSVDGYEYSQWGTYHRADNKAIGVERGSAGTNYSGQYNEPNKEMYANIKSCPDELLLFFHRVPYTHILHSGKTVIQHIYDTHFEGKEEAIRMQESWQSIKDEVEPDVFERVSERMCLQVQNATEWCDIVNSYFYRKCGIEDEKGRIIY